MSVGVEGGGGPRRIDLEVEQVRRLVAGQFPQWSRLPLCPVLPGGNDNRTWRLGDEFSVRLPSAAQYALAVEKEQRWLPGLAPRLPVAIPEPVGRGEPTGEFPLPWSVLRWIDGETATADRIGDLRAFAASLADVGVALRGVDTTGGPLPGEHNWFRGAHPAHYDAETRRALRILRNVHPAAGAVTSFGAIDLDAAAAIWEDAIAAPIAAPPVWFHGDLAGGNLLVRDGVLVAVIDFGTCGIGDPACDLAIAWTLFDASARAVFRERLGLDADVWARGRGWALWKAVITLADDPRHPEAGRTLDALLRERDGDAAR